MSSSIKAIDKGSVHRICSGQVILDLGIAVKELVENSLDAGASSVEVKFRNYGLDGYEVIDDGCGVDEKNHAGLTKKYCTSKLNTFDDLSGVSTFGFRGEALSSLCALANVKVTTRTKTQPMATRLSFAHSGEIISKEPIARSQGTTVSVSDLFKSLPVRHKEFCAHYKREYAKALNVLYAYGIVAEGVRISCTNQGPAQTKASVVFSTQGGASSTLRRNLVNIFGPKLLKNTEAIDAELDGASMSVSGFVSKPGQGCGRASGDRQFFFVNRRPVDLPKVARCVNEVYRQFNHSQYPVAVLCFTVQKESVDVNVTPDKRKIFMNNETVLLDQLKRLLSDMYEPSRYTLPSAANSTLNEFRRAASAISTVSSLTTSRSNTGSSDAFSADGGSSLNIATPGNQELSREATTREGKDVEDKSRAGGADGEKASGGAGGADGEKMAVAVAPDSRNSRSSPASDGPVETPSEARDSIPDKQGCEAESEGDTSSTQQALSRLPFSKRTSRPNPALTPSPPRRARFVKSPMKRWIREGQYDDPESSSPRASRKRVRVSYKEDDGESNDVVDDDAARKPEADEEMQILTVAGSPVKRPCDSFESNVVGPLGGRNEDEPSVEREPHACSPGTDTAVPCNGHHDDDGDGTGGGGYGQVHTRSGDDPEDVVYDTLMGDRSKTTEGTLIIDEAILEQWVSWGGRCHPDLRRKTYADREVQGDRSFVYANVERELNARMRGDKGAAATSGPGEASKAESELSLVIQKEDFLRMHVVGQFNLGFIIARKHNDLFIVDQHASDEKYNFEKLQESTVMSVQRLIRPVDPELTAAQELVVMNNLEVFQKNGFEFVVDENKPPTQRLGLTTLPFSKNWTFGVSDVHELVSLLEESPGQQCRPSRVSAMFASRACRKSIMVGTALNHEQMQRVLTHMATIDQPWNCPHGRPTMRHVLNLNDVTRTDTATS
eukprot:Rmarinus@m.13179